MHSLFISCFSFPRFVVRPLELGLGTSNTRFVAWPLELGLGSHHDHEFRLMCRVALDGKEEDIPVETRSRIVCALRFKQYHVCTNTCSLEASTQESRTMQCNDGISPLVFPPHFSLSGLFGCHVAWANMGGIFFVWFRCDRNFGANFPLQRCLRCRVRLLG